MFSLPISLSILLICSICTHTEGEILLPMRATQKKTFWLKFTQASVPKYLLCDHKHNTKESEREAGLMPKIQTTALHQLCCRCKTRKEEPSQKGRFAHTVFLTTRYFSEIVFFVGRKIMKGICSLFCAKWDLRHKYPSLFACFSGFDNFSHSCSVQFIFGSTNPTSKSDSKALFITGT